MPVIESRKITKGPAGDGVMRLPIEWMRFFKIEGGTTVDVVADTPVVVFPPHVEKKKDRIEALQKIIQLIDAVPERPYPIAKRGRGRKKK